MSTFPYVDISHKKIWRPLSTGRYVDPTLVFFIYLFLWPAPCLPLAKLRRFVRAGQVPRGLHRDVAPSRRFWAAWGLRGAAPLPPPLSPLLSSPGDDSAGSMTPC